MAKIALFGTSADPPTVGHQRILEWLALRFDTVAVWASDNPFKSDQTPLAHRQAMLVLLVETVRDRHPNVYHCPALSHGRSLYSVERARQTWPQDQLTLVVGSDVLDSLLNWYRIQDLLQAVPLLVVPRPDFPANAAVLEKLTALGGQLTVAADFVGLKVSSTDYRQTRSEAVMLPPIADYIECHGLYAKTEGENGLA